MYFMLFAANITLFWVFITGPIALNHRFSESCEHIQLQALGHFMSPKLVKLLFLLWYHHWCYSE